MPNVLRNLEETPARRRVVEKERGAAGGFSEYAYRDGLHEIRLLVNEASTSHAEAVRSGPSEFALVFEDPVVVLCAKFGDAVPWTAAILRTQHTSREPGSLPPAANADDESRALLHVALVDKASGATRVERNVTLWMEFTRALHEAIRERARAPFHPVEHERTLARLCRRYPTHASLAESARTRSPGSA